MLLRNVNRPPSRQANREWQLCVTDYGGSFVSAVQKGNVVATQFHPEKSGEEGLGLIRSFLDRSAIGLTDPFFARGAPEAECRLAKRIIACLDVRSNDAGDLVVTKGDCYDVREAGGGEVRNLGKPVALCKRYYEEGADEVTFLNITAFRDVPLENQPMLEVLTASSKEASHAVPRVHRCSRP